MGVVLAIHFGNVAVIRKAEIGVVADYEMLVDGDPHDPAGMN